MSKQPPPAPTASTVGPCPTIIQICRTPRQWKFTRKVGRVGAGVRACMRTWAGGRVGRQVIAIKLATVTISGECLC